jgi:hypothetical protein
MLQVLRAMHTSRQIEFKIDAALSVSNELIKGDLTDMNFYRIRWPN